MTRTRQSGAWCTRRNPLVRGLSCDTCHPNGSQLPTDEENMCLDCHAWPRPEQSLIPYMDL